MEMVQIVESLENIKEFFKYSIYEDETVEVNPHNEAYGEINLLYEIADMIGGRPIDVLRPRLAMKFISLMNQIGPIDFPEDVEDEEKEKIYKNVESVIKDLLLIAGSIYADGKYERC